MADCYANPYAALFIREKTSVGLQNEEKGVVELPVSMTKQSIYTGWCYSQGFKAKADAKGNFGSVGMFEQRPNDDILWPVGSDGVPLQLLFGGRLLPKPVVTSFWWQPTREHILLLPTVHLCLWTCGHALRDLGWLVADRCGGRLSIIMDNCSGQNKNKMVLQLVFYLVEQV